MDGALIIDNSRPIRRILGGTMRQLGFDVAEAGHGREALEKLVEINTPVRLSLPADTVLTSFKSVTSCPNSTPPTSSHCADSTAALPPWLTRSISTHGRPGPAEVRSCSNRHCRGHGRLRLQAHPAKGRIAAPEPRERLQRLRWACFFGRSDPPTPPRSKSPPEARAVAFRLKLRHSTTSPPTGSVRRSYLDRAVGEISFSPPTDSLSPLSSSPHVRESAPNQAFGLGSDR